MAMEAFLSKGWEVATVTGLQTAPVKTDLPVKQYAPKSNDPIGLATIPEAIEDFKPDRIFSAGEPGSLSALSMVIPARIPFTAYCVIEGEPIALQEWRSLLSTIQFITCSEYGAKVVRQSLNKEVDWAYHGVDTDVFRPDDTRRDEVRKNLGWNDKFVVITVAANVRRKQHPRLFEAMGILRDVYKQKDILLYDHTVPFQRFWLEGWHLPQVARSLGVEDMIMFNPEMENFGDGIPERSDGDKPTLPDLYRAADLFVLPSQVEGFGLPIAEAMACGTPVAVTKYAAGWEVARGADGAGIPVADWEIHKSGTRYANVSPLDIAKTIISLKRDPKRLKRMREAGLKRASELNWSEFQEKICDAIEDAKPYAP
jgi:glycosyltransferase involved in cell wall biosynthesis